MYLFIKCTVGCKFGNCCFGTQGVDEVVPWLFRVWFFFCAAPVQSLQRIGCVSMLIGRWVIWRFPIRPELQTT